MIEKSSKPSRNIICWKGRPALLSPCPDGADSCALLLSLLALGEALCLKIIVAHFNHGLRHLRSDEDEVFCRNMAQKSGLVFVSEKMRQTAIPRGMSPEVLFSSGKVSLFG